jgi:xylulokinase
MKYLAGIDIGTTGAKCGIFDLAGNLLAFGYREYICEYPQPNWVEQDALLVTGKAFEAAQEALQKADINAHDICSIALSTQRTCSIFLDEGGEPLKMISWQDNRAVEEVKDIASRIKPEEYYRITGLPLNTTWIIGKILWVRKNLPDLWKRTKKIVQLQDFVLNRLGADGYYTDIPDAVLYGMWDTDRSVWSKEIIDLFDVDMEMLPKPTRCGSHIGSVSREASIRTGFAEGTPICVGAGDQNAAAVGAGVVNKNIASISIGTGGMAITMLDRPYRDPAMKACIGSHAIFGNWQFEGYQIGAAGVFRWFRDEIAALEKADAQKRGESAYIKLDEMIRNTMPGANGLICLPFLASAAAPRWNPDARGALLGLTFAHGRKHMARAVIEGITLEQKDILNSMLVTGNRIDKVRIMGGAAKSELWCQIQADMYNSKVETLRVSDAALVGAAIFAGIGVGLYGDVVKAAEEMVHPEKEYAPDPERAELYEELYGIYCDAYEALDKSGVYGSIAKFQSDQGRGGKISQ